jgi:hypothetical protein
MKALPCAKVDFAELNTMSRKKLIGRILGMRQGAAVFLSRPALEGMSMERLRLLFLIASLYRAVRARAAAERLSEGLSPEA